MKRFFFVILSVGLISEVFAQTRKPAVAVMDFNGRGVSQSDAASVADLIRSDLVNTREVVVLDRANMSKILKEQELQQSGCTDTSCAVKIGQLLSMQFMILGSVVKLGDKYIVTIDMIDVEKGTIVVSQKENVNTMGGIVDITPRITQSAINKMKDVLESTGRPQYNTSREKAARDVPSISKTGADMAIGKDYPAQESSFLKTTLFISGLATLAAAGTLNVLGLLQSGWATEYYNNTYMTETGTPAAIATKYSNYQGMVTASTIEYIIGWSLYGVTAGLAVWWFLTPDIPVRSKTGKTAIVPSVSPVFSFADGVPKLDGAAVSFSMCW